MTFNPLIATVFYQRHRVVELWVQGAERHGCDVLMVGSQGEYSRKMADRSRFHYLEHENTPLHNKYQSRVNWFLSHPEYTHLILLGSDDLLCPKAFDLLEKYAKKGFDLIAWKDMYFYDTVRESFWYFGGYGRVRPGEPAGPGKCLSRKLVEKYTPLWDGSTSPDRNLWNKVKYCRNKIILSCRQHRCYLTGVKSQYNITTMERMIRIGRIKPTKPIKAI